MPYDDSGIANGIEYEQNILEPNIWYLMPDGNEDQEIQKPISYP